MAVSSGTFVDGVSPITEDISLFLVQVLLIVILSRVLGYFLSYINQPSVISEVVGGIILGPTCLSRIPAFHNNVFPQESLPRLKLFADFGLILYLFLVGLELDVMKTARDFKKSALISIAGIILPFIMGVAASKVLYDVYGDPAVPFTSFFVFCGVAMSITGIFLLMKAFPVLARILASRKLMATEVGQFTLSAAATDDAIAWCLLILVVALINNPSKSINALIVFVIVMAYGLFLFFCIRPIFLWMIKRSSPEYVASEMNLTFVFLVLCASSWFTQGVGVHSIFGAFLTGLIVPHEEGFAIKVAEKLEDLVSIILLPIYFAYSGLKTQLGALDDALSWGLLVLVLTVACGGKIIGCSTAAWFSGRSKRESLTIGLLMNTKGLVELIVLNLGLQAGVINEKVFAIFVMMALITTFMTVPLVSWVYPFRMYLKADDTESLASVRANDAVGDKTLRVMVCLINMHTLPSVMNISQMLCHGTRPIELVALRLIELGDRMSKIMMASDVGETLQMDPIMNVFKSISSLNNQHVQTVLEIADHSSFGPIVVNAASQTHCEMIIFPVDIGAQTYPKGWASHAYTVMRNKSHATIGLFGERGLGTFGTGMSLTDMSNDNKEKNIVFAYFGTADDISALEIILSICRNHDRVYGLHILLMADLPEIQSDNVAVKFITMESKSLLSLINKLKQYGDRDLVVLGHESYETVHEDGHTLHQFVDIECASSFLIIHSPRPVEHGHILADISMKQSSSNLV